MTPVDAHVTRCRVCGCWKFTDTPCPGCSAHKPTTYTDERLDKVYRVCAECGEGWPCDNT